MLAELFHLGARASCSIDGKMKLAAAESEVLASSAFLPPPVRNSAEVQPLVRNAVVMDGRDTKCVANQLKLASIKTRFHSYKTVRQTQWDFSFSVPVSASRFLQSIRSHYLPALCWEFIHRKCTLLFHAWQPCEENINATTRTALRRLYIHTDILQLRIQRLVLLPLSHSTQPVTFSDSASWITGSQHNGEIISSMGGGN